MLHNGLSTSVPTALIEATARAATATLLAGRATPSTATAISASVAALVQAVIRTMTISNLTALAGGVIFMAVSMLILGGLVHAGLSAVADHPPQTVAANAKSLESEPAATQEKAGVVPLDFRVVIFHISRSRPMPRAAGVVRSYRPTPTRARGCNSLSSMTTT